MDTELNLIVIRCRNIDRSAEFYRTLGLPLVEEKHGDGPRHFAAGLGRLVFEIYPLGKRKRATTQDIRLGFSILALDETVLALKSEDMLKFPATTERGYMAVIQDPDGHIIELLQTEEP